MEKTKLILVKGTGITGLRKGNKAFYLNPSKTHIIHEGKCYEVPNDKHFRFMYGNNISTMILQSLPEVK